MTGTPIQNAMKDLFGLLAFLRVSPLYERPVFNAALDRPITAGDATGLLHLKVLMSHVALRRLKTTKVRCEFMAWHLQDLRRGCNLLLL